MKEEYFVQLDEPTGFRKDLLLASKSTLHSLAKYNYILQLRELKGRKLLRLRADMKELLFLVNKLKEALPHFSNLPESEKSLPDSLDVPDSISSKNTSEDVKDIAEELKKIDKKLSML
ncbi:hypothetical protein JW868_04805 [Candidatus Woesearchaeota archaeon]|nr:hypothetical protein [Candidatus Woesearchaeota archaeon]